MTELKKLPLGIYEKAISNHLTWEAKYDLARESGYDCIEISVDGTEERAARLYDGGKTVSEINRAKKLSGMTSYTMALTSGRQFPLGSEDDTVRNKGLDMVERAIAFAEETGIGLIHLAGYDELGDRRNENTDRRYHEAIAKCVRLAEKSPVTLAIETMDTPYLGSCARIISLIGELGTDKLKIYSDTGNLMGIGLNAPEEIRAGGKYIAGTHLKDATPGVMRDVVFGTGIVNFEECFKAFQEIGFSGPMTAEMWSYDKESFHPMLKTAADFLRTKLAAF